VALVALELRVAPEAALHVVRAARTDGHGRLPGAHIVQPEHGVCGPIAIVHRRLKALIREGVEEIKAGGHICDVVLLGNITNEETIM